MGSRFSGTPGTLSALDRDQLFPPLVRTLPLSGAPPLVPNSLSPFSCLSVFLIPSPEVFVCACCFSGTSEPVPFMCFHHMVSRDSPFAWVPAVALFCVRSEGQFSCKTSSPPLPPWLQPYSPCPAVLCTAPTCPPRSLRSISLPHLEFGLHHTAVPSHSRSIPGARLITLFSSRVCLPAGANTRSTLHGLLQVWAAPAHRRFGPLRRVISMFGPSLCALRIRNNVAPLRSPRQPHHGAPSLFRAEGLVAASRKARFLVPT